MPEVFGMAIAHKNTHSDIHMVTVVETLEPKTHLLDYKAQTILILSRRFIPMRIERGRETSFNLLKMKILQKISRRSTLLTQAYQQTD